MQKGIRWSLLMKNRLKLFLQQQKLQMTGEHVVQGGHQILVTDGRSTVYCTIYRSRTILVQGANSKLKDSILKWAGRDVPDYKKEGAVLGWPALPLGWREWKEDAEWLKEYIKKRGVPNERNASEQYRMRREVLFHDFMFRNQSGAEISFVKLRSVLRNWFNRFCYMSLDVEKYIKDVIYQCCNGYSECREKRSADLSIAADAISMVLCGHCSKFFVKKNNLFVCPQTQDDQGMCTCQIVDALYPYCSGKILAYNQSNFYKLLKRKDDLKWMAIRPSSLIEINMAKALESAGLLSIPQYQAYDSKHRYKIDFVIKTSKGPFIAIECDGLEFHARKSTYVHDRIRDRYLQQRGFYVMRFSSVEIFNNLDSCLEEVDKSFWKIQMGKLSLSEPPRNNYFGLDVE
jgi:very-short-patch-repair endonuclease